MEINPGLESEGRDQGAPNRAQIWLHARGSSADEIWGIWGCSTSSAPNELGRLLNEPLTQSQACSSQLSLRFSLNSSLNFSFSSIINFIAIFVSILVLILFLFLFFSLFLFVFLILVLFLFLILVFNFFRSQEKKFPGNNHFWELGGSCTT